MHEVPVVTCHSADAQNPHLLETPQPAKIEQRRHQLPFRQIAGRAEDHDHARFCVRQWRPLHFAGIRIDQYC